MQMGPGLSEGDLLLEEHPSWMDRQDRGLWWKKGGELFCEGRAGGQVCAKSSHLSATL